MKVPPDLPVEVLVGGPLDGISCQPTVPFSDDAINFLGTLSRNLLASSEVRQWPDIVTFAYWCRVSNLKRLKGGFDSRYPRLGRGLVLHIAPSNVPVNFAFSMAFGILAGNANIVRLPSDEYPQVKVICNAVESLFRSDEHKQIAAMSRLVRYERAAQVNEALSACSRARMIWGGDSTVAAIRAIPASASCIDICFPDRYSICVLAAEWVLALGALELRDLARRFHNDAFLFDQNACSSPHLIAWIGDPPVSELAMARFWAEVREVAGRRNDHRTALSSERLIHACEVALQTDARSADWRNGELCRVRLQRLPDNIEDLRGRHGFFIEYVADEIDDLTSIINERYQTLTVAGMAAGEIQDWVVRAGLAGIDRVVPVGKALDMGSVWDGYDLIAILTRIIADF